MSETQPELSEGPIQSLEELLDAINCGDPRLPWQDTYPRLDWDDVPTFGGAPPKVLDGVVSWDQTRLLVKLDRELEIIRRVQWGGAVGCLGHRYLGDDPGYAARWLRRIRLRMCLVGLLQILLIFGPATILITTLPLDRFGWERILGVLPSRTGASILYFIGGLLTSLSVIAGWWGHLWLEKKLGVRDKRWSLS